MKIAIYGDSHGAADKKVDSWHTVLGKLLNAEVKTFAMPGSSNLYNYKNFLKHNKNFDWYPWLTSGKWHIFHHNQPKFNFGVYFPIWDILFKTHKYH